MLALCLYALGVMATEALVSLDADTRAIIDYAVPVPDIAPSDRLTPDSLRAILSALDITPEDFGFVLH